jgi:outer membrane protein assembly factor BamB
MSKRLISGLLLATTAFLAISARGRETGAGALKASGVRGGLCVVLGVVDGQVAATLTGGGRFLVHCLAGEEKALEKARAHLRSKKLYGQVSVERSSFKRLPYADNLINLVVVADAPALLAKGLSLGEVVRILAPGGAACLGRTSAAIAKPGLNGAAAQVEITQSGGWTLLRKKRLAGTDEWTHWRHGPDGNAVSSDEVGVPCSLRWQAGPRYQTGAHYYGGGVPVSAGGRLFTVTTEESQGKLGSPRQQVLWCRDAHNGLLLWKRATTSRRSEFAGDRRPLVAAGNRLYAVLERSGPLLALDAATGKTLKTFDAAINADDWLLYAGSLIVRKAPDRGASKLLCLDPASGAVKWQKPLRVKNMVVADGNIFCLTAEGNASKDIVCLDAKSGAEKWRAAAGKELGGLLCHFEDVLVFGSAIRRARKGATAGVQGVSARDGKQLWSFSYGLLGHGGRPSKVYCVDGLVWVNRAKPGGWVGLNPRTGKEDRFLKEAAPSWSRNLCADNRATRRFILTRTMLFVDVKSGKYLRPWGFKNACSYGSVLPANGLIYTFPHQCRCYPMLRGIMGLASKLPPLPATGKLPEKLERGTAWGSIRNPQSAVGTGADWPIYRADTGRSGSTKSRVSGDASKLWEVKFGVETPASLASEWRRRGGGSVSAATAAGGRVFVALPQQHRVVALEAKDGRELWSFTAGGRVDTPPTIHNGLCLFGSSDGWVYCLNSADGRLVWRFRAAPTEWKICAFGQFESAWPVHGSVLVHDGVAYVAAGRHSRIDGGAFLYALNPASGKLLWSKVAKDYHGLVDLLVSDGKSICFASRHYDRRKGSGQFDPKTGATRSRKERADGFLTGNTGLLSEMWLHDVYKGSRLSVWTAGKLSAQKLVLGGSSAIGFRAAPRRGQASLVGINAKSGQPIWKVELPLSGKLPARHVKAIALTGDVVWVAGRMAESSNDSLLRAYSAKDGRKLGEHKLPAAVVNDGIAAAGGHLYVSTVDGRVFCFGKK